MFYCDDYQEGDCELTYKPLSTLLVLVPDNRLPKHICGTSEENMDPAPLSLANLIGPVHYCYDLLNKPAKLPHHEK